MPDVIDRYYPKVSMLWDLSDLPEFLAPFADFLNSVFDDLYFSGLKQSQSVYGDRAYFSLDILAKQRLEFEFPGTGVFLVLNPGAAGTETSAFPFELSYSWPILAKVRKEDFASFDHSDPGAYFMLALELLDISDRTILTHALTEFVVPTWPNQTAIEQFVFDVNLLYEDDPDYAPIQIPDSSDPISQLLFSLNESFPEDSGRRASSLVFLLYLFSEGDDIEQVWSQLKDFFFKILPTDDFESYVKDLIIPVISARAQLVAAVEFDRGLIQPVFDENGENPSDSQQTGDPFSLIPEVANGHPKARFSIGQVDLNIDSRLGVGIDKSITVSSSSPFAIGKSRLILDLQDVTLDLSEKHNILLADLDGRSSSFKGIGIGEATIGLPTSFAPAGSYPIEYRVLKAERLLIGNPGGISGHIYYDNTGLTNSIPISLGSFDIALLQFDMVFDQGQIISSSIMGTIAFTGDGSTELGDSGLQPSTEVTITYAEVAGQGVYSVTANQFPDIVIGSFTLEIISFQGEFTSGGITGIGFLAYMHFAKAQPKETTGETGERVSVLVDYTLLDGVHHIAMNSDADVDNDGQPDQPGPVEFRISELEVSLKEVDVTFSAVGGQGSISSGMALMDLTIPMATEDSDTPSQDPVVIQNLGVTIDDNLYQASATFAGNPVAFRLGKVRVELESLEFAFDDSNFQSAAASATIFLPDAKDEAGLAKGIPCGFDINEDYLSFEADLEGVAPIDRMVLIQGVAVRLDELKISFDRNGFVFDDTAISATILYEKEDGSVAQIQVSFDLDESGYVIMAEPLPPVTLFAGDVLLGDLLVKLDMIALANTNGEASFGIGGEIYSTIQIPLIDQILPEQVSVNELWLHANGEIVYDVNLKWPSGEQFGGTNEIGLTGTIPVNLDTGLIGLQAIRFELDTEQENILLLKLGLIGARLTIGPVSGFADGMGFNLALGPADTPGSGNFGDRHLAISFDPPTGIGIAIDAGKVQGSGYLYLDYENQRYFGYLSLSIADKFDLMALGLLAKNVPGHPDMTSFLAMISMSLPKPIPIAFGFELTHVGGLVAINRDMDTDAIRDSIRTGALDNILFPDDPEGRILQVIADLEAVFPAKAHRHSFAIMGKLRNSAAVQVELGFLLSVPSPIKLGIVGLVKVLVKSGDKDIVKMNALFGILLDYEKKLLSVDIGLYDSKIAGVEVTGDIALRYSWGAVKYFAFSAGGFHPAFTEAENYGLAHMRRIQLIIKNKPKTKIMGAFYLAVTSNTFQAGARIDIYKKLGPLSVEAYVGLDTLFNFNPFRFIVSVQLGAEIKFKRWTLMGIHIAVEIQGPKPWYIYGSATVEIGPFNKTVRLNITIGDPAPSYLETVDLMPLLMAEIEKPSTYRALDNGPGEEQSVVLLAQGQDSELVLFDPSDTLTVRQPVLPFNLSINKYGESPTAGEDLFRISEVLVNGVAAGLDEVVRDYFAPNQYRQATHAEKLEAKSFESLENGRVVGGDVFGIKIPERNSSRDVSFEMKYREREESQDVLEYTMKATDAARSIAGGAFAKSSGYKREARRKKKKGIRMRLSEPSYGVVKDKDIRLKSGSSRRLTRTEAGQLLRETQQGKTYATRPSYEYRPSPLTSDQPVVQSEV